LFSADADDMELILRNLVSNAIKYNKPEGRVDIRLTQEGNNVRIQVADTGIGIKPQDQTLLFREFSRIKNEATLQIPGSGLGLSIVKKVATLYDGEVLLDSEEGKGTTFIITLKSREQQ
jgi:signal transduction histidine kinase